MVTHPDTAHVQRLVLVLDERFEHVEADRPTLAGAQVAHDVGRIGGLVVEEATVASVRAVHVVVDRLVTDLVPSVLEPEEQEVRVVVARVLAPLVVVDGRGPPVLRAGVDNVVHGMSFRRGGSTQRQVQPPPLIHGIGE